MPLVNAAGPSRGLRSIRGRDRAVGYYRAGTWNRPRRVVLVVLERADEQQHLVLDHFLLLSNATADEEDAKALLGRYHARGTAEKDFGDWKTALDVHLSSAPQPKAHYGGRPVRTEYAAPHSLAANQARPRLSLLAANLLHRGRERPAAARGERWSRERFRAFVLNTAARVLLASRGIPVWVERGRARRWMAFWQGLERTTPPAARPPSRPCPPRRSPSGRGERSRA